MNENNLLRKEPRRAIRQNNLMELSGADIVSLYGKPAVMIITKDPNFRAGKRNASETGEEWIYYIKDNEEHYFFKNNKLIRWEKVPFNRKAIKLFKNNKAAAI